MELIIIFIVGCVICSIICAVFRFVWEHRDAVVGWTILIIALGVIATVWDAFETATADVPIEVLAGIVVAIVASVIIIVFARSALKKSRAKKMMKWLNRVGVGKVEPSPRTKKILDYLVAKNSVLIFAGSYIVSTDFGEMVQRGIYDRRFITQGDMKDICLQTLPTFDTLCFGVLFNLFRENLLIPFPLNEYLQYYVSIDFVIECSQVFELEGAATKDELSSLLKTTFPDDRLKQDYSQLAQVVLDHMVASGKVQATKLGGGTTLYVAKNPQPGCKMTRREISLD